jgi:hypothetical protein
VNGSGREFLDAPPARWVELHRTRRPESLLTYESALGRLLARVLAGEELISLAAGTGGDDRPARLTLRGLSEEDRSAFARLSVPEADERNVPAGGIDLSSIRLPALVRREARWTMSAAGLHSYVELTSLDAVVCQRLLAPLMADLAYVLRLRAGEGPKSVKGRADRLARCREAHETLGLAHSQITALIDPQLDADGVIAARASLVTGWAEHPADLGERAIALLCGQLARAYYGKARKDGTVEAARVLTASAAAQLDATLGRWPALLAYLGEEQAAADARPVETPETKLPDEPPRQVAQRLEALRAWWAMYDGRHAAQRAGMEALDRLVPTRWDYTSPEERARPRDPLERRALNAELLGRIETLWGSQVLDRHPETLVDEPRPLGIFAELLQPAAGFWDELSLTAWFSCLGPYARRSFDELEAFQRDVRQQLDDLGAPIDLSLYDDLDTIVAEHPFLREPEAFAAVEISIELHLDDQGHPTIRSSIDEPQRPSHPEAFEALRETITRHRRAWLEHHLDRHLDRLWRGELSSGAEAYWARLRGRGKPPTLKQALPDLRNAARHWFGSDHGELARLLGLDGPITVPPVLSPRTLPSDMAALELEVAARLGVMANPEDEGRERRYDLERLAMRAQTVMIAWQATGSAPARSAVLSSNFSFMIEQTLGCNLEEAYELLLRAMHEALERRGHPAAATIVEQ